MRFQVTNRDEYDNRAFTDAEESFEAKHFHDAAVQFVQVSTASHTCPDEYDVAVRDENGVLAFVTVTTHATFTAKSTEHTQSW